MANADLTLRILAKDEASATLSKIGKAATAALSVAAITEFGRQSVLAFADAEKAQLRLTDAFARFPAMGNIAISSLRAYNTELMRKTGFDDDAIASGQAVLAQFRLTGQQVKDVTPLLVDYAAATGRDIPDAAKLLGKASLGNTRALKDLGISYKATGNQAEDFAAVQALVAEKVGGFAAAEAQTAAGQLRRLSTAYGELQEGVGGALAPALVNAADGMMAVSDELGPMLDDLAELTGAASSAGSAVMGFVDSLRDLPGALPTGLLDGFGMGLGSFVTGLLNADAPVEQVKEQMADLGYAFDETTQSFVKSVPAAGAAAAALDPLDAAADAAANSADALSTAWKRLNDTLAKQASKDEAVKAVKDLRAALKGADEAFSGTSDAALENRNAIRQAISAVSDYAQKIDNPAKRSRYLASQIDLITAALKKAGASPDEIERLVGPLQRVGTAAGGASSKVQSLASQIRNLDGSSATVYVNTVTGGKAVHAAGGPVVGPGGPTDDAVPAMLSNGEYVIRAASVKRYGLAFLDAVNSGRAVGLRRGGQAHARHGRGRATPAARQQYRDDVAADRETWRDALIAAADDAAAAADEAAAALRDGIASTVGRAQAFGSVTGVDVSSSGDIFAARRALNQALGTEGEGAARAALADAQQRSTPRYILDQVRAKLAVMQAFGANLKRMLNVGYPVEIVTDLFRQGYDGARTAEILAAADPGTVAAFREAQAAINAAGNDLGVWAAGNLPLGPNGTTLQGNYQNAQAVAASASAIAAPYRAQMAQTPFQVNTAIYLDGRKIVEALQDYRRSIGGAPLGLS